ncbi:MAG: cobalamin biosynthesis protein CbiM [Verrucomicrobiaceae bacterium]|nr:MAG: cobalamin biosynthesis protein CbiM [Verrucomicrobiaceae bacterium]
MHIPSAMLHGSVCPVTAVVAATGVTAAVWAASKSESKPTASRFAAVSALVFAAQMMNFPVQFGTSGHILGGVLASVLLGTPFGILSMSLVLSVQCLLFSDGGLAVLGTNILNMALLGAGVGGWLAGRLRNHSVPTLARIGFAAWASVVLASLACSIELAAAGVVPFSKSAPMMLGVHALIGIGEALLTVLAVAFLPSEEKSARMGTFIPAAAALVLAMVLSPFASGLPDGLEWVSSNLGFWHEAAPAFAAPLSGYSFPGLSHEFLSSSLAGAVGVLAVFAFGNILAAVWTSRTAASRS